MNITPEIQKKIEISKHIIQKRAKDNEWGELCFITKLLVFHGFKKDAKILIQSYLKEHQNG